MTFFHLNSTQPVPHLIVVQCVWDDCCVPAGHDDVLDGVQVQVGVKEDGLELVHVGHAVVGHHQQIHL